MTETRIITETKQFLVENGVNAAAFEGKYVDPKFKNVSSPNPPRIFTFFRFVSTEIRLLNFVFAGEKACHEVELFSWLKTLHSR